MASNDIDSQSLKDQDEYKFQIIEFIARGGKKMKSIDIVPSSWVFYDQKKGKLVTKFMPPPYNAENNDHLHKLVRNSKIAPEDWPTYNIKIRGHSSK